MSETSIIVDKETVTALHRAHYEYESYKDVVMSCLDLHRLDTDDSFLNSNIFKGYQDKAQKAFIAYNELKGDLEKKYELKNTVWNLDFTTGELTIN